MRAQRRLQVPATDHRQAIRLRTNLEAKLLAYRSGWLPFDEIKIRKLERELQIVLSVIGNEDTLACQLIGN